MSPTSGGGGKLRITGVDGKNTSAIAGKAHDQSRGRLKKQPKKRNQLGRHGREAREKTWGKSREQA